MTSRAAPSRSPFGELWVQPKRRQRQTRLATFTEYGRERPLAFRRLVSANERGGRFARQKRSLLASEPRPPLLTHHLSSTTQAVRKRNPGEGRGLPRERVDFQRELLEEGGFGGVGQDQDHVHVTWP